MIDPDRETRAVMMVSWQEGLLVNEQHPFQPLPLPHDGNVWKTALWVMPLALPLAFGCVDHQKLENSSRDGSEYQTSLAAS